MLRIRSRVTPECVPIQDPRALSVNARRLQKIYSLRPSHRSLKELFAEVLTESYHLIHTFPKLANDPSSPIRPAGRVDCKESAMANPSAECVLTRFRKGHAARNILRAIQGLPIEVFHYKDKGT